MTGIWPITASFALLLLLVIVLFSYRRTRQTQQSLETEARQLESQILHQATHDSLTGLANRHEFERRLERLLHNAQIQHAEHALCYLDLDQFKVVNDTCGHAAGDELLRQIADLFKDQIRTRDTLARLGGDEFAILLEHCALGQAQRVANGVLKAVEAFRFEWEEKSFTLGVTIGLVPVTRASESVAALLCAADSACYIAKDAGRNRIHVYHENDAELTRRHGEMQWVSRLQQALEENRLQLYAQPIVPANIMRPADATAAHFELLLRLADEDGQIILPGNFLPAAERYHLAARLDRWVVSRAFRWLAEQPDALLPSGLCWINLSGQSLGDETFQTYVIKQLNEIAIPARRVCFEVTETAAITNLVGATRFMNTLKARGCCFALDDFGSGLSSFGYLKNLPVDFVKIDGHFVKDIVSDPISLAMVRAVNEIGHLMGKKTVAEHVENPKTLQQLRDIGVDYAQGHLLGYPKPLYALAGAATAPRKPAQRAK